MSGPLSNQLQMFMSAGELRGMDSIDVAQTPESRFGGAWNSLDDMWATKRRENKMDRFDEELEGGVQKPVTLGSGQDVNGQVIVDGHHRIESRARKAPDELMPVVHRSTDTITASYGEDWYDE